VSTNRRARPGTGWQPVEQPAGRVVVVKGAPRPPNILATMRAPSEGPDFSAGSGFGTSGGKGRGTCDRTPDNCRLLETTHPFAQVPQGQRLDSPMLSPIFRLEELKIHRGEIPVRGLNERAERYPYPQSTPAASSDVLRRTQNISLTGRASGRGPTAWSSGPAGVGMPGWWSSSSHNVRKRRSMRDRPSSGAPAGRGLLAHRSGPAPDGSKLGISKP
jgi:hypothetical protein